MKISQTTYLRLSNGTKVGSCDINDGTIEATALRYKQPVFYYLAGEGMWVYDPVEKRNFAVCSYFWSQAKAEQWVDEHFNQ